jgi:hypothetical protein
LTIFRVPKPLTLIQEISDPDCGCTKHRQQSISFTRIASALALEIWQIQSDILLPSQNPVATACKMKAKDVPPENLTYHSISEPSARFLRTTD